MIDINFKSIRCTKCDCNEQYAIKKSNRYGIYCHGCGRFIKWADHSQTVVIEARKAFLEGGKHDN